MVVITAVAVTCHLEVIDRRVVGKVIDLTHHIDLRGVEKVVVGHSIVILQMGSMRGVAVDAIGMTMVTVRYPCLLPSLRISWLSLLIVAKSSDGKPTFW